MSHEEINQLRREVFDPETARRIEVLQLAKRQDRA